MARVERGPATDVCVFKRYLPPRPLSWEASTILSRMGADDEVALDRAPTPWMRQLERERIVEIGLPDDVSFGRLDPVVNEATS